MHELSLCAAIADIVTRRAEHRHVAAVHVRIGELRQVVPDTLAFCWTMVTDGTDLADRRSRHRAGACDVALPHLRPESAPIASVFAFACSECGSVEVDITAGDEFDVTALDLVAL